MRLSEHRVIFSDHVAELVSYAPDYGLRLAINEVKRTEYQQAKYVEDGLSWTMNSDHLNALAVDFVFYRPLSNGRFAPIWNADNPEIDAIARRWIVMDPVYNYWGYAEWAKDTPHFGRKTRSGLNSGSRQWIGLGPRGDIA
jgi:hypothetical protein